MEREYIACCSSSASMPSNDTVTPNMRTSLGLASQSNPSNGPPSSGPSHHHSISNPGCMASRILSRNANGTIAMTSQPTNESELQLYRVLQRANLLSYYDTFICQGGDDVQQLCEAGEEEFLEIMALVGMASKPLHVRRLQKALQEWVSNPAMFQAPIIPPFPAGATPSLPPSSHPMINQLAAVMANRPNSTSLNSQTPSVPMRTSPSTSMPVPSSTGCSVGSTHSSPSPNGGGNKDMFPSQSTSNQNQIAQYINQGSSGMICNEYSQPSSPITLTPVLLENQIQRLSEVAEMLVKSLPPMDPKPQLGNNKKRISKELEYVMNMPEDDPRRMDEIRKYAAIYGRFDCKRKPEKPLTLHEVSVNEAAAQICKHIPALLSRRDELFPLARQVVRDSGYQYSKGHSRSQTSYTRSYDESDQSNSNNNNKRSRIESSPNQESKSNLNEEERKKRQERLEAVVEQLKSLGNQHEEIKIQLQQANDLQNYQVINQLQSELDHISTKQMQLVNEQSEINKQLRRYEKLMGKSFGRFHSGSEVDKGDTDDTDSQFSIYSNESSPSVIQESHHDSRSPPVNQESLSSSDGFSAKMLPTKKTGNTMAASHITKQLVQDTLIDEGLRVVKELTDQINELNNNGVDLRINNKSSTDSSSILSASLSTNNHNASAALLMNSVNNRCCYKQDVVTTPRPRGRPPKFIDRESFHHQINQISFHHNQMFSPNHLPHHLLANFHASAAVNHHQLLQAAIHTNGFDSNGTNGHFGHSPQNHSPKHNQLNLPSDLSNHNNINSNNINVNNNECNKVSLNNSLDALISLNGNSINNDSPVKQEPFSQLTTINNNLV